MPGASVIGTASESPLIRPNQLRQAPCHVGPHRAASPAAQGSPGSAQRARADGARRVMMQSGTDVVRCSTVAVRHHDPRWRGTMHADAASRLPAQCIAPRARRADAARHAGWPGYC
ncbi:hypothetical protein BFF94_010255 [Burkholderia catarinensis]|nr:hypothetical protein BFF94_010255 [Burkholderia catarinensis]